MLYSAEDQRGFGILASFLLAAAVVYEWHDLHIFQIDVVLTEENLRFGQSKLFIIHTVCSQQGMLSRQNQEVEYEPSSIAVSASIILKQVGGILMANNQDQLP